MITTDLDKRTFTVDAEDSYLLVLSAMRYALGRRTYIVGEACRWVRMTAPVWSDGEIRVAIRDIKEQGQRGYGDECDRVLWVSLLAWLEGHLEGRGEMRETETQ